MIDAGNHKGIISRGSYFILFLFNKIAKTEVIERGITHW